MNVQLHHVVADVTGATGLKIIRAIVAGERDPAQLAQHRERQCKNPVETIEVALRGHYRDEHVFALTQAVQNYDFCHIQVAACDQRIEDVLARLRSVSAAPAAPLPKPARRTRASANGFAFDVRAALYSVLGLDATQINGIGPYLALKLVAECGTDMTRWPSAKHFTSWLCLAPGNKISGGKVLSSRTRRSGSRAAAALRLAATTVGKTDTARKIAVLFYNALRHGMQYQDPGASYYEERYRQRVLDGLRRRASSLGYTLQQQPMTVNGVSQESLGCAEA